jgi:hypothetical protein
MTGPFLLSFSVRLRVPQPKQVLINLNVSSVLEPLLTNKDSKWQSAAVKEAK